MARKTVSYQPRTHQRLAALTDGFDDSMDKIANRLLDFWHKYKDRVDELENQS